MNRDKDPKWNRIKRGPFHRIGDSYSHFFNTEHFMGRSAFDKTWLAPEIPSNLRKEEEAYTIEMALPGFKKEEISIYVEDDLLRVKAEREDDYKDKYLRKEIHLDSLKRNFQLEENVDRDKIEAAYENGLLRILLPPNGKASHKKKLIKVA
ncbi:Hsp20/alpha crystallin family protein [Roseivirga echinicomitans]|uniref:SHSP domain-containing protein n=1 Tax=Roseivirga echinicomitans TaxID=296218 RepID=A0A150XUR7_9BACT|nr:Hsp20/alpha crystallin family protein [Roseivirga echinicomitans]KYG82463.1 hypothetical protein AWN68_14500 [Roseivirga echinicomitans]